MYRRLTAAAALSAAIIASSAGVTHAATGTTTARAVPAGLVRQIAAAEGVTPQVLRQDLRQGKTLLQIAGTNYSSAGALATALLTPVKARLDKATGAGRAGAVQENLIYTRMLVRTTVLVEIPHPLAGLVRLRATGAGKHSGAFVKQIAATCQTTSQAFQAALHVGGADVLAICQRTNPAVTQDSLTAAIYAPIKQGLDKAVAKGWLTTAAEADVEAQIQPMISAALTFTAPTVPAIGA